MKKKWGLILLALALIILIGGASVLYNKFSAEVENERMMAADSSMPEDNSTEENAETENPAAEDDVSQQDTENEEPELIMAPDFTVFDENGAEVKLSDFTGKPAVINFWASWCGPCQMEMPDFNEKYEELGEEIQFLMINMTDGGRETLETAKDFVKNAGYTFPVYYDTEMNAAMTYGASSLPVTYFIDAQGHAVAWAQGAIDAVTLQKGIDMILK